MAVITQLRDKLTQGNKVGGRIAAIRQVLVEKDCWEHLEMSHLDGRSVAVRVPDVTIKTEVTRTPSEDLFELHPTARVLKRVLALKDEFALKLNVRYVNLRQRGNAVLIGVPLDADERQAVEWEPAYRLKVIPDGCLLLGLGAEDGEQTQVCLNIASDANAHVGIVAMTGYGKTNLLQSIVLSAFSANWRVALFDIRRGLWALSGHPRVWRHGLFVELNSCALGLQAIARRIDAGQRTSMLVVIDELPELMRRSTEARDALQTIVLTGRSMGLRTIMGLQQPANVPGTIWANVPVRLVGHVANPQAAYDASGIAGTDAQKLGQGDFLVVQSGSITTRFRAPLVDDDLLRQFTARYPPRIAAPPTLPRVSVAPPTVMSSEIGGSTVDDIPVEFIVQIRHELDKGKVSARRVRTLWEARYAKQLNHWKAVRALEIALGE